MARNPTLLPVCRALKNPAVVDFVREVVRSGYHQNFPERHDQVDALVEEVFARLSASQREGRSPARLEDTVRALYAGTFAGGDPGFWFNHGYHRYKTQTKPETDFQQLTGMIHGRRVLDYGCGSGYLAARLAQGGYRVVTTDVLDYRYPLARHLPFVKMTSPTEIAYPDDGVDTALVQAVLHHIWPEHLAVVIRQLARVARYVLIKEDTFDLPGDLPGLEELSREQPLLTRFRSLSRQQQWDALVLIDYHANAIAQGIPEMNMPFNFKSIPEWRALLAENDLGVSSLRLAGFEIGRMHQTCHAWLICARL